ncbi:MAG: hypothetical protein ACLP36_10530 [Acidimicrobiales bacterium]
MSEIRDLFKAQNAEIEQVEVLVENLSDQLSRAKALLSQLLIERDALESVARRRGLDIPAPTTQTETPNSAWATMNRVDAVEQVLAKIPGSVWHLSEIEAQLELNGRSGDTVPLISATIAHLKRTRGSVESVGTGVWRYVPEGERVMRQIAKETHARLRGGVILPPPIVGPAEAEDA